MENTLEKINQAAIKLLLPLTLTESYKTIIDEIVDLTQAQGGVILRIESSSLKPVYEKNLKCKDIIPREKGFTYKAFSRGKVVVIYPDDFNPIHPQLNGLKTIVFIPLSFKGEKIGVISIEFSEHKSFDKSYLNALSLFGTMASLAIKKAQLYDETKRAIQTRDYFISMASHELRTPISSIKGYTELLNKRLSNSNSQESKWTNLLSKEVYRLTQLVNELLEINNIRTGRLQFFFKEYDLRELVKQAMENFKFIYSDMVVFRDQTEKNEINIICDPNKLTQVINNLLDNAIKFSPKNEKIRVNLKLLSSGVVLEIINLGKVIAKRDINRIFSGFYRGNNARHEGMGLGLFLVKHIIKKHRGKIFITSSEKKGTIAKVELPIIKI